MRTHALIAFVPCCPADSPAARTVREKARPPLTFRKSLRSMSRLLRSLLDGGNDAVVGSAPADVAVHVADDLVAARTLVGGEELGRFHDLARLAIAALRH